MSGSTDEPTVAEDIEQLRRMAEATTSGEHYLTNRSFYNLNEYFENLAGATEEEIIEINQLLNSMAESAVSSSSEDDDETPRYSYYSGYSDIDDDDDDDDSEEEITPIIYTSYGG